MSLKGRELRSLRFNTRAVPGDFVSFFLKTFLRSFHKYLLYGIVPMVLLLSSHATKNFLFKCYNSER